MESFLRTAASVSGLLAKQGYSLSSEFHRFVEALREREPWEVAHDRYANEILIEALWLRSLIGHPWNKVTRAMLPVDRRSSYLDRLEADCAKLLDSAGEQPSASRVVMDANEVLFHTWKLRDWVVLNKNSAGYQSWIQQKKSEEVERFKDELPVPPSARGELKPAQFLALFRESAKRFGFESPSSLELPSSRKLCFVMMPVGQNLSLFLEWVSPDSLRWNGGLRLRFVLRTRSSGIWTAKEDMPCFTFGLSSVAPGAEAYLDVRGSYWLAALALRVHLEFMKLACTLIGARAVER